MTTQTIRNCVRRGIVACVLMLAATIPAAADTSFGFGAGASWRFGTESYQISGTGFQSQLDFPLDGPAPSLWLALASVGPAGRNWSAELGGSINVLNPSGSMIDRDWYLDPNIPSIPPMLFSYTESTTVATVIDATAAFTYDVLHAGPASFGVTAGYHFTSSYHSARGLVGYQYIYDSTSQQFDLYEIPSSAYGTLKVLTYQILMNAPSLGVTYEHRLFSFLDMRLQAAGQYVFAYDVDDHVLRTKRSVAYDTGPGYRGSLELAFYPDSNGNLPPIGSPMTNGPRSGLAVIIGGSIEGFKATGLQTQTWYGSSDPGVAQGTVASNIPHILTGFRSSAGFQVRYSF